MKQGVTVCLLFFVILIYPLFSAEEFKLVESWNLGEQVFGYIGSAIIDADGHVPIVFRNNRMVNLINPKEVLPLATLGQAPGQITSFQAMLPLGKDLGILEYENKMQIYAKKNNNYVWKETIWFKRHRLGMIVNSVARLDNRWYFAGLGSNGFTTEVNNDYYIMAYQENRQPIKTLLHKERRDKKQIQFMASFLAVHKDLVYYMQESELTVTVIAGQDATVKKTVKLEQPYFYKKLPPELYILDKHDRSERRMELDSETWYTGYSRISKMVIEGDSIVLQLRTCDEKLKRYCLLFYNVYTFKLERQIFTDDYFLGAFKGKYYMYANGNPSLDEIPDICRINIYQLVSKKGK